MPDIIKLHSRFRDNNVLKKIEDKKYKLNSQIDFIRVGYIEDSKFVDPPGGPMLIEGDYLEEAKATIKKIYDYDVYKAVVIEFK